MPDAGEVTEEVVTEVTQPFQVFITEFLDALPEIIAALVIFFLTLYLAGLVSRAVRGRMATRGSSQQAVTMVSKIARFSVLLLGSIAALEQVGFNLTAFLTGLGVVGFTIGFALQDVSKNFVSGLILLIQQPFSIGEAIKVTGFEGNVIAVDLRATELHTFDGQVVLIPNSDILTNPIVNYSRAVSRRIELQLGVSYQSNPEHVRATILRALSTLPGVLQKPAAQVVFQNFGNYSLNVTIYYWVDTSTVDILTARDSGLVAIKAAFAEEGIELPPLQNLQFVQQR